MRVQRSGLRANGVCISDLNILSCLEGSGRQACSQELNHCVRLSMSSQEGMRSELRASNPCLGKTGGAGKCTARTLCCNTSARQARFKSRMLNGTNPATKFLSPQMHASISKRPLAHSAFNQEKRPRKDGTNSTRYFIHSAKPKPANRRPTFNQI